MLDSPLPPELLESLRLRVPQIRRERELAEKFLRVNVWLAVENYGIGYRLSDGTVGELLPDKSLMFFRNEKVCYSAGESDENGDSSSQLINELDIVPESLYKKHKMLKYFRSNLVITPASHLATSKDKASIESKSQLAKKGATSFEVSTPAYFKQMTDR